MLDITKIDHVGIRVRDRDRAVAFDVDSRTIGCDGACVDGACP